jgi:diguanylate cyclase (GGDEF)-like protein/PAS domain S-box-containing protein
MVVSLLWLHGLALGSIGIVSGNGLRQSILEASLLTAFSLAAGLTKASRVFRQVMASVGLLIASALVVHLAHGALEARAHLLIVLALVALYEDIRMFVFCALFIAAQPLFTHLFDAAAVYSDPDASAHPWRWGLLHGGVVAVAGVANLVTWRVSRQARVAAHGAARRARHNETRFRRAFDDAPIGMCLVSVDEETFGRFLEVNQALVKMTGYSEAELLELTFDGLTHPADRERSAVESRRLVDGEIAIYGMEKRYLRADGAELCALVSASVVRDEDDTPLYCIGQIQDITARKQAEAQLAHQALHDPLTGLPNRLLFQDRLRHALARLQRGGSTLGVIFVDVDDFKLINDTLGHEVGDRVLTVVGKRLNRLLRESDTVARFGGDEFTILCEDVEDPAILHEIAERMTEAIAVPLTVGERELVLSASLGIAIADDESADADALVADADAAMYHAKASGRGRFMVFHEGIRDDAVTRLELEAALRGALEREEFAVHYQPVVELETGRVTSFEALVRWRHPDGRLVSPDDFVPVAEETGAIIQIGVWVLEEACREAKRWQEQLGELAAPSVGVNLSARQFADPDLLYNVTHALSASGLSPKQLCLEITETAVIEDFDATLETLTFLNRLGVRIAIDDFGTGFSSLGQLRRLPPLDVLKIDKTFIDGMCTDQGAAAIVQAVVSLADALGLTVVAEGVESADQAAQLQAMGCQAGQGYHFARPQPAAAVKGLLRVGLVEPALSP